MKSNEKIIIWKSSARALDRLQAEHFWCQTCSDFLTQVEPEDERQSAKSVENKPLMFSVREWKLFYYCVIIHVSDNVRFGDDAFLGNKLDVHCVRNKLFANICQDEIDCCNTACWVSNYKGSIWGKNEKRFRMMSSLVQEFSRIFLGQVQRDAAQKRIPFFPQILPLQFETRPCTLLHHSLTYD